MTGRTGAVWIGGADGVFRSGDQGADVGRVRERDTFGLSLAPDGAVYVSGADKVAASQDGGKTWAALPCPGLDTLGGKPVQNLDRLARRPAPDALLGGRRQLAVAALRLARTAARRCARSRTENRATLPSNARQGYATWSPTDPNVAYSLGGDWVTKSTDGGKTFHWSNNGYNGIMVGGLFNFSAHAPDTVFLGFQDYNGAFTTDGGKTWNYRDISGKRLGRPGVRRLRRRQPGDVVPATPNPGGRPPPAPVA